MSNQMSPGVLFLVAVSAIFVGGVRYVPFLGMGKPEWVVLSNMLKYQPGRKSS